MTLQVKLADVCKIHEKLLASGRIREEDRQLFSDLMSQRASDAGVREALRIILCMMADVYGRPGILLLDEYDVPLISAREQDTPENRYYPRMLQVIRGMLDAVLTGNNCLKRMVVTGCLPVAGEIMPLGDAGIAICTVLDDRFSRHIGFTEEDVERLLRQAGRTDRAEEIRSRYGGFVVGSSRIYCSWDVICHVASLLKSPDARIRDYWKGTSHNGILRSFFRQADSAVRDRLEILLNGGTAVLPVSREVTSDMLRGSCDDLWSVLLMTGYLTKAGSGAGGAAGVDGTAGEGGAAAADGTAGEWGAAAADGTPGKGGAAVADGGRGAVGTAGAGSPTGLRIPNAEIFSLFAETAVSCFYETLARDRSRQEELMASLWDGDEERASVLMTELLQQIISFRHFHEDYYHAFLTGIVSGLGYALRSGQEWGLGRLGYDVREKRRRWGMLLEVKKSVRQEDMEKDALAGRKQILDREYQRNFSGYESVICYGIAFFQKKALVRKLKK